MGNAEREREQELRCRTIQSQAERRDHGQTEESWLLFEGIGTFLYDLIGKIENRKGMNPGISSARVRRDHTRGSPSGSTLLSVRTRRAVKILLVTTRKPNRLGVGAD